MGEEIVNPVQEALKEKYTKTHINQANRDWAQRKNIKSSMGKQQVTYMGKLMQLTADLSLHED